MADLGFVHRYLPGSERDAPVLLLLHGTGGNEEDLIPLAKMLMPQAGVLSVRGKVLENGMPRFFRRFAEGVFDLEDLKFRTEELAAFLDAARAQYQLTKNDFIALGYSNGANIASSLLLSKPGYLRGAILMRAMVTIKPDPTIDLSGISILLCEGEHDPIVPKSNGTALAEIFKLAAADLTLHWHKGGHELGQDDVDAAKTWLRLLSTLDVNILNG
jgi:predicted esterase